MPNSSKLYKIGKEIIEARNMGEALGIRNALATEGKVAKGAVVVEHADQAAKPTWGAVEVKEVPEAKGYGKVQVVPAVAAVGSPMEALRDLGQKWDQAIVQPAANAIKNKLTPDINVQGQQYKTASPVSDQIIETAADPVNYVPGGAGAVIGGAQAASQFAEGGEVEIPQGDVVMDAQPMQASMVPQAQGLGSEALVDSTDPSSIIPDEEVVLDSEKYGTLGQQAIAGLEGAAHGIAGPLATLAETKVLGVPEEDILARQKENPISHGVGQAVGIGGSMLSGVGMGAGMAKAGTMAAEAAGLANAANAGWKFKVGSEAVKQAAEMAVLSSADEASKMILNDPETSTESAISNVGLGAVLGATGGALWAGAVNPLWNATAGKALESTLSKLSNHLNGAPLVLPEQTEAAINKLGLEVAPEIRAGLSGDENAVRIFSNLKEAQSPEIQKGIEKLHIDAAESVARQLGVDPSDIAVYSKNEAGHGLLDSFKKEYSAKYEPIEAAFNKRNAEAATIPVPDGVRLDSYGKLLEKAMEEVGTDSPQYKLYNTWGERLLAKDTVGGIDKLRSELGNDIGKAIRAGDYNEANALRSIRSHLGDLQEAQIGRLGAELGEEARKLSSDLLNDRAEANRMYREFAEMSSELSDNLGIGDKFSGAKALENKLASRITPEQLLNKFSIKNNADFIPFLQKYFPETLEQVKAHEIKELLKPAVIKAKGDVPVDVKKLANIIDAGMAGKKEYIESILSPQAIEAIQAARTLVDAVPNPKSSGTAGWMTKMFDKVPASALAAVSMIQGQNPFIGGLIGHTGKLLSHDVPNSLNLAYLKFLGSNQAINAPAFKSMVDFMRASFKGENMLSKATANVFKAGAQVIPEHAFPSKADNDKLDKKITALQNNPELLLQKTSRSDVGHYLANHQMAMSATMTKATQYLQSIKPQPHKLGPLDKEIPPQPSEIARYQRALSIANNPNIVLDHVKNGTILPSDIQDLSSMYPALYKQMTSKLSNSMMSAAADGEAIPYKTRIGASLFLGTPVDMSMQPASIMAAQPKPASTGEQQAGPPGKRKGQASKLGQKVNKMYMTPGQSAELDRAAGRD